MIDDDGELINLSTTRANDWTWAITGLPGCALFAWGAYVDWTRSDLIGLQQEFFALVFFDMFGAPGMRIAAACMALLSGLYGMAGVWRIKDGHRVLRADPGGLWIHPGFHPGWIGWEDVERVELTGRRPAKITIRLRKRFWSLTSPLTSRKVELNLISIGSTYRAAEAKVRQMRRWRKNPQRGYDG